MWSMTLDVHEFKRPFVVGVDPRVEREGECVRSV